MRQTLSHIKNSKSIILMLVVLFSLSPCTVKESIYQVFDGTYQRPVNKTKTTHNFSNTCQAQIFSEASTSQSKQIVDLWWGNRLKLTPIFSSENARESVRGKETKLISGKSPPMYILYKRMKIEAV